VELDVFLALPAYTQISGADVIRGQLDAAWRAASAEGS
jgi:hypothetical protein